MMRFCRSRHDGARCTRPLDHPGLHRHRAIMWSDLTADAAGCPGTGERGTPAPPLDDGYPHGRALCPTCGRFIELDPRGRLLPHDTSDAGESDAEVAHRREWFNGHGW
ncbi:hypothetical protein [Microbacterium oryzae]|uniref:Uncharacterized protein n=1 Tax=Microbacterium oryzae TaxID=743009 RepID=A0A6I6E7W8_9MICO|nr:hypothetical protein [Microbacterium oryzae]QGU28887.1 hypothetical protein D7D94_09075 [Microbacterium oryzae]